MSRRLDTRRAVAVQCFPRCCFDCDHESQRGEFALQTAERGFLDNCHRRPESVAQKVTCARMLQQAVEQSGRLRPQNERTRDRKAALPGACAALQ